MPEADELPGRLDAVLKVIYLVFNEGYLAWSGENLHRTDLADEAIRLARLVVELSGAAEAEGLLALMLLHHARAAARVNADGDIVPLDEQDRSLWNRALIEEGAELVRKSLQSREFGTYTLQAAIAALHCEAPSHAETDWHEIVGLYQALLAMEPSPVVELNMAVALAMRDGPASAVNRVTTLIETSDLKSYHLAHAARAELYHRLGEADEAKRSDRHALALTQLEAERRFLSRRLAALEK